MATAQAPAPVLVLLAVVRTGGDEINLKVGGGSDLAASLKARFQAPRLEPQERNHGCERAGSARKPANRKCNNFLPFGPEYVLLLF